MMALLTKCCRRDVEWYIHFSPEHFCRKVYIFNIVKYSRSKPNLVESRMVFSHRLVHCQRLQRNGASLAYNLIIRTAGIVRP